MKINNFRGDLTDITAAKEALAVSVMLWGSNVAVRFRDFDDDSSAFRIFSF